jgi:putative two-component system response regulator
METTARALDTTSGFTMPFAIPQLPPSRNGSMKILVADDSLFYRRALETAVVEWGYEPVSACDGSEALRILQSDHSPRLALVDWMMPKMEGVEVCQRIRATEKPEQPYIIVLTARGGTENIVQALESGADDYVTKPFDVEELKARIRVGRRIVGLQTSQTVVFTFARAVEAKSPYTQGHADRVTVYALALADHLGLDQANKDLLRRGAILHDIGKICVPDAILNKPGPLTPEELDVIKQHPEQGVKIVERLESVQDVIPLIRWHHERCDGKGYPDGLGASDIPPLVRILSVADVYDALASPRPYRSALAHEQCLQELRANASHGGLDPEIVKPFCQLRADQLAVRALSPPK